jgi:hypothetical protein
MKNFLIFIFTIFFSSIAHAGINEVGSGGFYQEDCKETILGDYKRSYEQAKSEGRDFIMYVSISDVLKFSHTASQSDPNLSLCFK